MDGTSLRGALSPAKTVLQTEPGFEETLEAIEAAEALAARDVAPSDAIARLGQGWVAEEALAIAIYCALAARGRGAIMDFERGVIMAVNHDGDSDSTGSIAGSLLGATHGVRAIPTSWLEPLELRDVISEVAEDLYAFKDWNLDERGHTEFNRRVQQKYPGC